MFKSLREKITENNSRNSSSEHNMSRFSSISSLVSDVGSAFSKALTNPLLVQPINKNAKELYDYDSLSEFEDSSIHGDVITKEELFHRYQRAQSLAKRYKTRSLEVVEVYKQLELENDKLTQTMTESQDGNVRRISELIEQIEVANKAKNESEVNYRLLIDEQTEMIDMLKLEVSLLKEGQDLPLELDMKIREKHKLEVLNVKKKDDEINELRSTMTHQENLLQRCKKKILCLNSELTEIKMKFDNINNTSIAGDSIDDHHDQYVAELDNINKEHNEIKRVMIQEFEEKKLLLETELRAEFERNISNMMHQLTNLNDTISRLNTDNERLEEQVSIKSKIIEDLMSNECNRVEELATDNKEVEIMTLLNRIKEMEEKEIATKEELKDSEIILQKEREGWENKCAIYQSNLDEIRMELNSKNEELSKNRLKMDDTLQKCDEFELKYQNLVKDIRKTEIENVYDERRNGKYYDQPNELEIKHMRQMEISINEKDTKIQELEIEVAELTTRNQTIPMMLDAIELLKTDISKITQSINDEFSKFRDKFKVLETENESLLNEKDEYMKLVDESEHYKLDNCKLYEKVNVLKQECFIKVEESQKFHKTNAELIKEINVYKEQLTLFQRQIDETNEYWVLHQKDKDDIERKLSEEISVLKESCRLAGDNFEIKNRTLVELEDSCKSITKMLLSDNLEDFHSIDGTSPLSDLWRSLISKIIYLQKKVRLQDDDVSKLQIENEELSKKIEKISTERIQQFKVLAKIFDVTSIDFEQNNFSKLVIRGLKGYAQRSTTLATELQQQVDSLSVECQSKEMEIEMLKNTASDERLRLVSTCHDLETRLEEFTEEKGRIDEEKQSLRKELSGLNEKIQQLKFDIEKQGAEKQKLEKLFDESMAKVKENHLALEENYKHKLETQWKSHQLSENVEATEELVRLNNQYKELLDVSKNETERARESLQQSELKCSSVESEIEDLRREMETLRNNAEEVDITLRAVVSERDDLKMNLELLIDERERSKEAVVTLQSCTINEQGQSLRYQDSITNLEERDRCNDKKLCTTKDQSSEQLELQLRGRTSELINERNKVEILERKIMDIEADHRSKIDEITKQFKDEKININDRNNKRVQRLVKDFHNKTLAKEQDFQKSLHDVNENIRTEEAQQNSDLKMENVELNRMVIELETEKSGLLCTISDCDQDIKNINTLLRAKESQLQSLLNEISEYKSNIKHMEQRISHMESSVPGADSRCQLTESICHNPSSTDTGIVSNDDILRLRCADVEEQLKKLSLENRRLKQTISGNHDDDVSYTPKSTEQSSVIAVAGHCDALFRSPNTSSSDYQFSPHPITESTEYEYLRHVLVKYMTGLETNTLSKVLCSVMKLSVDETDRILQFEQDKIT